MSRQAVSKHLSALSRAGLLKSERRGRERIWGLRTERIAEVQHYLAQISQQWDEAIERLRSFVENG
jgi:DNA-binding transcriptional ArsR family regulator